MANMASIFNKDKIPQFGLFNNQNSSQKVSPLYVFGNKLINAVDNSPVTLQGGVSDYFRYGDYNNIDDLIYKTNILKNSGGNHMMLYLEQSNKEDPSAGNRKQFNEQLDDLDKFIQYAENNGIYITLMPVARAFSESDTKNPKDTKLTNFVTMLAKRYKNKPNILYGIGAEVEGVDENSKAYGDHDWDSWNKKQTEIAQKIRAENPYALVVATGAPMYNLSGATKKPLPLKNVIYMAGGYGGMNKEEFNKLTPAEKKRRGNFSSDLKYFEEVGKKYPLLYGEFGGFWSGDFGSKEDLEISRQMLDYIKNNNQSFTGYKVEADQRPSGIGLFNPDGSLNEKGKLYARYFNNKKKQSNPNLLNSIGNTINQIPQAVGKFGSEKILQPAFKSYIYNPDNKQILPNNLYTKTSQLNKVRQTYGFNSPQYNKAFNEFGLNTMMSLTMPLKKPSVDFGTMQRRSEAARGMGLLTDMNDAYNAGNVKLMKSILNQAKSDSKYKGYVQTFADLLSRAKENVTPVINRYLTK